MLLVVGGDRGWEEGKGSLSDSRRMEREVTGITVSNAVTIMQLSHK